MELHAIQALHGDSLLLKYGKSSPKFILIDGGPDTVYDQHLKSELKSLMGNSSTLEAVIVSHVDNDHIVGILDFLTDVRDQKQQGKPFIKVKEIWLNTFTSTIDKTGAISNDINGMLGAMGAQSAGMTETNIVVQGIQEGHQVTKLAALLKIKLNKKTPKKFFSVENNKAAIKFGSLKLTVVGPTAANLKELKTKWEAWIKKNKTKIQNGDFDIAANSDSSIPNLSSIILLAEEGGKSILLTGDCRGDHLLEGLTKRKLLKAGKYHVDVLKVMHHGSNRNAIKSFFSKVKADTYAISADGANGNPDYETLEWIVTAAKTANRPIELIITNKTSSTNKLVQKYPPATNGYKISFIPAGKSSVRVI